MEAVISGNFHIRSPKEVNQKSPQHLFNHMSNQNEENDFLHSKYRSCPAKPQKEKEKETRKNYGSNQMQGDSEDPASTRFVLGSY